MNDNLVELKNKTINGLFWRFGERITSQIISFIVSVILARILLPKEYGIVALVTIFINLADVLVTSGLGTSLVQKKNVDELDFSTMTIASIILSIILYGILFIIAPVISIIYNNELLTAVIRVMGIRIPIAAFNSIQQAYVQKKMIYKKFFYSTLIGTVISAVVGIYMALNGYGVWALVGQYLTTTIIGTIVLFVILDWKPKMRFSQERFKQLFNYGSKIMAAGFIGCLFDQLRGLIIGFKYSSEDLAFNNKGEQFPIMLYTNINSTLESVLFSSISMLQDDKKKLKEVIRKLMKTSSFVIMPVMFGLLGVADNFVKILLTDKWILCVPFMRVVCVQECFAILNTVNMQAIKAIGRSDTILKLEFIKKPIYMSILLITMFISPYAVCIGCCVYSLIALFINSKPNKKYLNYTLQEQFSDTIIYIILSFLMSILVMAVGKIQMNIYLNLVMQIIVGAMFYLIISKILKLDSYKYIFNIIKERFCKKNDYNN